MSNPATLRLTQDWPEIQGRLLTEVQLVLDDEAVDDPDDVIANAIVSQTIITLKDLNDEG